MKWIYYLLLDFKFARRKLGGTWYQVYDASEAGGMEGPIQAWVRNIPLSAETEILKIETYEQP